MTRAQIERWREANRTRLTKEQLDALQALWTMASPAMFEPTDAGRRALETFERRADAAFSGREMDELSPYGPCIPEGEVGQARAAYAAGDSSARPAGSVRVKQPAYTVLAKRAAGQVIRAEAAHKGTIKDP
jgi:hypothetical protein